MAGLMDTFRRHSVVLAKFPGNDLNSRPYWPGGGFPGSWGQVQGAVATGPRRGGTWDQRAPELQDHPTPAPAGLPGARSAVLHLSPSSVAGCTWDPVLPTRYTHPYYPPGIPTRAHLPVHAVLHATSSATRTAVLGTL